MDTRPPHVLAVDDDASMRELLASYLTQHRMQVTTAGTGDEMQHHLRESVVDLVVLDLRLRDEDGLQLAQSLRKAGSEIPVIIITGVQDEADRVMGLEICADDYVLKPFSNREILARIRAVLRRYQTPTTHGTTSRSAKRRAYRFEGWELNLRARRLSAPDGSGVELSNGEFNLLLALCESPRRVLSRDQLLDLSRLHGAEVYDRSIDVQILRLRRKMEMNPSEPTLIRTQRGAGYYLDAPVDVLA